MKFLDTPIERYSIGDHTVYVKREDLCTFEEPGAPTFSKVRGLAQELKRLKALGFTTIGYVETSVSMAGWGVAWLAPQFGLKAVIFDPQYIITPERLKMEPHLKVLQFHRTMWEKFKAEIIEAKPGRAKVNYYIARNWIKKSAEYKMHLLPLGLPLKATMEETAQIMSQLKDKNYYATVVVNVGSGTICAGLLKGLYGSVTKIIGVMGRKGNVGHKKRNILAIAGLYPFGKMFASPNGKTFTPDFDLIQSKYEYTQPSPVDCPFLCHPYYDLKAWEWLVDNIDKLESPVLFWNIGSLPKGI